jgi:hypothetical protein
VEEREKKPGKVISISDRAPVASGIQELDISALEETLRKSSLLDPTAEAGAGLEHATHALAKQIVHEGLDRVDKCLSLDQEEKSLILALALAFGFNPSSADCSPDEFRRVAEDVGLDIDATADICPEDTRSLDDVLNGSEHAGLQSPFVDVFCTRADGDPSSDIRELLIVGRGVGVTRELIQDIAFGAALSLEGRGTLCDGMIHLFSDEQVRVKAMIGRQVAGLLHAQTGDQQLVLDFAWSEFKAMEQRSAYVRTHTVSPAALEKLRNRISALEKAPIARAAFLLPDPDAEEIAADCASVPIRGSVLRPILRIPKEVVTSWFFKRHLGLFEKNILQQLILSAERRVEFYRQELEQDRDRMASVVMQTRALLNAMRNDRAWKDQRHFQELEKQVTRSLERLSSGESADQPDAEGFGTLLALAYDFSCHVIESGTHPAGSLVTRSAAALKEALEEEALLTFQVVGGYNPRRILLPVPKPVRALDYLGTTLPGNILNDLEWLKKTRELAETVKSARNAAGLRRWTTGVVLDLALRGRDLDFGGAPAGGFTTFREAVRPLLLLLLARALENLQHSIYDLASPNLAFSCVHEGETLLLVPTYFVNGGSAALSFRQGGRVAALSEPTPQAESGEGSLRDPTDTLQAIFAEQPEQRVLADPDEIAGLAVVTLVNTLSAVRASPAATLLAARAIYSAHALKPPFTKDFPQNQIPELTWYCLQLVLRLQLALERPPRIWNEKMSNYTLIGTWLDELASGRRAPATRVLPATPQLRELVEMCREVAEEWQPGFLKQRVTETDRPSERLRLIRQVLQGHKPEEARVLGIDCDAVRKAWARYRGNAIHHSIPALSNLVKFARTVVQEDRGQVAVAARVAAELAAPFVALGSIDGEKMHELLDLLFGAQAKIEGLH